MKLRGADQACTARVFILSSAFALLGFAFLHSLAAGAQVADTSDQSYYKNARPLLDRPLPDILEATPELQGLEPAGNQEELPFILDKAEKVTKDLLVGMPNLIAREDEVQATLSRRGHVKVQRQLKFNYMIVIHWNVTCATFEEYRSDAKRTGPWQIPEEDYTLTTGFASQWLLFLPSNRSGARFRYLGQQTNGGVRCYVVAFAQIPGSATFIGTVSSGGRSDVVMYQGIAWIDKASFRIVRLRTDLLAPRPEIKLETQTTELHFGEARLPQTKNPLWLPHEVVVTTRLNHRLYRNIHRYSDYRVFKVESRILPAPAGLP